MKYSDYKALYDNLKKPKDIADLAREFDLDEELLDVLYTQRTVRDTTKRFYRVKNQAHHMLRDWKRGKSIIKIARKEHFSPILTGLFIFQENGHSKKYFWNCVRKSFRNGWMSRGCHTAPRRISGVSFPRLPTASSMNRSC
jgi:hypothetical protein